MLQIRLAKPDDAAAVAHIQVDNWNEHYTGVFPDAYLAQFNYEERTQDWRDWFSPDQRQVLFVAEEDGEIVGIALGDSEQHLLPDSGYEAELAMLHVRTSRHSRGIGHQLLQALARYYHERGIKSMVLITLEKNTRARRFYEKHGARLLDTREWDQNAAYGTQVIDVVYGWSDIGSSLLQIADSLTD